MKLRESKTKKTDLMKLRESKTKNNWRNETKSASSEEKKSSLQSHWYR